MSLADAKFIAVRAFWRRTGMFPHVIRNYCWSDYYNEILTFGTTWPDPT